VNLVKDETSLKCLNEHIKKKRAWREDLIDKFLLRCKSQKPKEIFPIEDSSVKSALNKKVFQEYFQSIHGTSPTNRPNRFYSSEIYKPAASLEELILPTSPLHAERVINSTKNNFTTASGFFGTSAKPTSINTFETEQTQTKPNLTRYVIPSRSQKKMHGQTYVDHRKWLEETLKGNTENSKLIEGKSIQNSKNTNTITSTSKGMFTIPKNSKLEPLNYVKQTEEQEVKQKAKVWAHYLHAGKNIIKRAEEKNRVVLKVRANQLAGKKGLNLVHQINDLLSKDLIKDSLKKNPTSFKEIKKDNKNREKHYLGHAASEKGLYYNFDGAFEGPSPLVRSLILSYRKIGENKKDLE